MTALAVDSNNTVLVSGDLHGMNIIIQPIMSQEIKLINCTKDVSQLCSCVEIDLC